MNVDKYEPIDASGEKSIVVPIQLGNDRVLWLNILNAENGGEATVNVNTTGGKPLGNSDPIRWK